MPTFKFIDGVLTPESFVKATLKYTCAKGSVSIITLDWPRDRR
ncbi:hypothetical protein B7760_00483 [Burkholderia glumae]|nr:hypothetical protein KS03_1914 [Burkholderia glumae LMG 2196 = ATCC 33617]QKM46484.1 hypothetical protein B7760_00483 [Burkholderia glumae]QKM53898.1 hypothetical protein CG017_01925 [Burkholderia glumae]QTP32118.1 hypothetical protein B7759_00687 [Burkholderia glumae]